MYSNLQTLRALAAFMVFCYHALPQYKAMGGGWRGFESFAGVGYAGVDVFFVISGFVAALTTLDKDRTWKNAARFLLRRVLRIYLGYWPFFVLAAVVFWRVPGFSFAALDLPGSFFLYTVDMPRLLLYVSWSLTYELIFYVLVAATFTVSRRVWSVAVHILFAGLAFAMLGKLDEPLSPAFIFLGFLLEFLGGALLFLHRRIFISRWWAVASAAAVYLSYKVGAQLQATDGSVRIFTFGLGALFFVILTVALEQSRVWVTPPILSRLGDASYTLYLVHLILLVLFAGHVREVLVVHPVLREVGFFTFLMAGLALSRVLYLRLELPLYRWSIGVTKAKLA